MSFLTPYWLVIAGLVAAGVVVAHLITTSQPRHDVLPTVRFIPQTAPLTVTRTRRPTDLLLLALRVAAVLLFGLALAGPHLTRSAPRRVVIADMSRSAGDTAEVRDSVRSIAGDDGIIVLIGDTTRPATLSGALVAAQRAIAGRDDVAQAELVIVSPLVREEVDSATAALLQLWPGPVRLARVRATAATPAAQRDVHVRTVGDDPVAAVRHWNGTANSARVRVSRGTAPTATDSAWVRDSAGTLVVWPTDPGINILTRRATIDTVNAIAVGRQVVVTPFIRTHLPGEGRPVAWWQDGEPAASERPLGRGCIREVAIPVDAAGDVALRRGFRGIVEALTAPCGGLRDLAAVELASLLPSGDSAERSATIGVTTTSTLSPWLAMAALLTLLAEQWLRRRRA